MQPHCNDISRESCNWQASKTTQQMSKVINVSSRPNLWRRSRQSGEQVATHQRGRADHKGSTACRLGDKSRLVYGVPFIATKMTHMINGNVDSWVQLSALSLLRWTSAAMGCQVEKNRGRLSRLTRSLLSVCLWCLLLPWNPSWQRQGWCQVKSKIRINKPQKQYHTIHLHTLNFDDMPRQPSEICWWSFVAIVTLTVVVHGRLLVIPLIRELLATPCFNHGSTREL